jgi:hypothetical protein
LVTVRVIAGLGVTANDREVVASVTPLPDARTVRGAVPAAADAPAERVRVALVAPAATGLADQLPVTPAGRPVRASEIGPAKLPPRVTVTATDPFPSTGTLTVVGAALTVIVPGTATGSLPPQAVSASAVGRAYKKKRVREREGFMGP